MKNIDLKRVLVTFKRSIESSTCCGADITGGCTDGTTSGILCKSCYKECQYTTEEVHLTERVRMVVTENGQRVAADDIITAVSFPSTQP